MDVTEVSNRAGQLLSLEGKVAVVTGAASGIGREIAVRLAEMGSAVAVLDKNVEGGMEAVANIQRDGGKAIAIPCNVRSRSDCREAVKRIVAAYGRIDILCNNAGVVLRKDVLALEEEEWDLALDVTLKSAYLLSREVIPHMIRNGGGAIVNTGSGWALKGGPRRYLRLQNEGLRRSRRAF